MIRDVLRIIDAGTLRIAVVIETNGRLIGTITDGDIRRGLLNGLQLTDKAKDVMNANPVVSLETSRQRVLAIMEEKQVDQIPIIDQAGMLVGIETIHDQLGNRVKDHPVVLMAGGMGTRLRPLTDKTPKPMIKVGDKPLLEDTILNLKSQGFQKFYLSVNYLKEVIQEYFSDGAALGVQIKYLIEENFLGTAGALSLIKEKTDQPILVMNGDIMTTVRFEHLLDFHQNQKSDITTCVRDHQYEIPFGVVEAKGTHLINIKEKPLKKCRINAGVYVIEPHVLSLISHGSRTDMPDLISTVLSLGGSASIFPIREYWLDIGNPQDLKHAQLKHSTVFGAQD